MIKMFISFFRIPGNRFFLQHMNGIITYAYQTLLSFTSLPFIDWVHSNFETLRWRFVSTKSCRFIYKIPACCNVLDVYIHVVSWLVTINSQTHLCPFSVSVLRRAQPQRRVLSEQYPWFGGENESGKAFWGFASVQQWSAACTCAQMRGDTAEEWRWVEFALANVDSARSDFNLEFGVRVDLESKPSSSDSCQGKVGARLPGARQRAGSSEFRSRSSGRIWSSGRWRGMATCTSCSAAPRSKCSEWGSTAVTQAVSERQNEIKDGRSLLSPNSKSVFRQCSRILTVKCLIHFTKPKPEPTEAKHMTFMSAAAECITGTDTLVSILAKMLAARCEHSPFWRHGQACTYICKEGSGVGVGNLQQFYLTHGQQNSFEKCGRLVQAFLEGDVEMKIELLVILYVSQHMGQQH